MTLPRPGLFPGARSCAFKRHSNYTRVIVLWYTDPNKVQNGFVHSFCITWNQISKWRCTDVPTARYVSYPMCQLPDVPTARYVYILTTPTGLTWNDCQRPYHVENTGSPPIAEVKQRRARLVLGWVTTWEHRVLLASFFVVVNLIFIPLWNDWWRRQLL